MQLAIMASSISRAQFSWVEQKPRNLSASKINRYTVQLAIIFSENYTL